MGADCCMSEPLGESPRIGLLNLMPAPALPKTEHQWRDGFMGLAEIVPVRFDQDPRVSGCRTSQLISEHVPMGEVQDTLDGLIVTGANLEVRPDGSPLPFDDIEYIAQLREVIDWAETHTRLTVYSCLASHVALDHMFGLQRDITDDKTFGVFCHDVRAESALTEGLSGPVRSPHSRWGDIPAKLLEDAGVDVLLEGFESGWLLAEQRRPGGATVFLQGHPEYERDDLAAEFCRDAGSGQVVPQNYFPGNNPANTPSYSWHEDRHQLFTNLGSCCAW